MLDTLSIELLEHISSFLKGSDISSLRLVCRSLRQMTTTVFGRAWLSTIETDLSENSLRRLKIIADHEIFRGSVSMLRIVEDNRRAKLILGGKRVWPRRASNALDLSSALVRDFHDILRHLDNCTTFEVCDRPGSYFDDSPASLGLSAYDALHLALSAIGTDVRPVQTLRIYLEQYTNYRLAKHLPMIAINSFLFPSLQELDLALYTGDAVAEQGVYLIKSATHLKKLRLAFGDSDSANRFLNQLATVPALPPIAKLRFGRMMFVSCTALVSVILRFEKSLCSLHIGHITLHSGDWSYLFGELSRHDFTCLESIALCYLSAIQQRHVLLMEHVYFCPLRLKQETLEKCGGIFEFAIIPTTGGKCRVGALRYTGPRMGMELALKALADDSHYLCSRLGRSPSPGLPNMKTFTGDSVGRVVPRFDQFKTFEGFTS